MNDVWVALETSTRTPSIAVERAGRRSVRALSDRARQASDLLPVLAELLRGLGASARQISAIAVGTGPGSYTGLRVGVATALGLARANDARVVGVPSPESWVFGRVPVGRTAAVVLDARSGELYVALYRREERCVSVLSAPTVARAAELDALLERSALVLTDAEGARAADLARRGDVELMLAAPPDADALLTLGQHKLALHGADDARAVAPLYLRAFAAKSRRR
jgi:tRNA threonylcarbamoyladenosine biosynthesis protein TsaB